MDEHEIVARWQSATRRMDPTTAARPDWSRGPVATFLHAFRPDGATLGELFSGMPELLPVLERLRTIFLRAGPETGHLYFVVSRPRPMKDGEIAAQARAWLASAGAMAGALALEAGAELREAVQGGALAVEVVEGPLPAGATRVHPVAEAIFEAATELGRSWTYPTPAGRLLVEPLYQLACSYPLAYWVLTPLALEARGDPFAAAAALWEAAVELRFEGAGRELRVVAHRCPPAAPAGGEPGVGRG